MMNSDIRNFDIATDTYLAISSQQTYRQFLDAFACALYERAEAFAIGMPEDASQSGIPAVRLSKVTAGEKSFFGFYTSDEKAKKSPYAADLLKMPLDRIVDLTLSDSSVSGLMINPGIGAEVIICSDIIRDCRSSVTIFNV